MRYPALRFIVVVHYVLAFFVALVVFGLLRTAYGFSIPIAFVLALVPPVGLAAVAEALRLLLSIEESVRTLRSGAAAPMPTTPVDDGPKRNPYGHVGG